MTVLRLLYLCFGFGIVNLLVSNFKNRSFLSDVSAIGSTGELDRFKSVARKNMYAALAQIVFVGGGRGDCGNVRTLAGSGGPYSYLAVKRGHYCHFKVNERPGNSGTKSSCD